MKQKVIISVIYILGITIILGFPNHVLAFSPEAPLEINLSLGNTKMKVTDSNIVKITLVNNSPFEVIGIGIDVQENNFEVEILNGISSKLLPYRSDQITYRINPNNTGYFKIISSISYYWKDNNNVLHSRIDVVSSEEISVLKYIDFEWPSYIIPLIIGFIFGQISTLLGDWYKQLREDNQKIERTKGLLLAGMQAAKKCVETKEIIPFSLWEDYILKENLYPSLIRIEKKFKVTNLANDIADISMKLNEYNKLCCESNLNEDYTIDIEDELDDLIAKIKNY